MSGFLSFFLPAPGSAAWLPCRWESRGRAVARWRGNPLRSCSCSAGPWPMVGGGWVRARQAMARKAGAFWQTNLLVGLNAECLEADATERRYTSAILIQKNGQVAGRYDKIHCVAFGEYVPLRDWIPWMKKLAPYDFDYSITPGQHFTRFALGNYHFGVVICYEDTDPTLARQYVHSSNGEPLADFL